MHWKTKAAIQRLCGRLPFGSEALYYQLQRRLGNLREPEPPFEMFRDLARIGAELEECGRPIGGARVFEVGTGHRLHMPLGFHLAGAKSITTVDLHRILKPELVMLALDQVLANREETVHILRIVAPESDIRRRIEKLDAVKGYLELVQAIGLDYRAPSDATNTGLAAASFDLHFSYTVFEHIPADVLMAILRESRRLLVPGGLACHHIDLSDHCSHSDNTISKINFLEFSDQQWEHYNSDRFGYQNRLREPAYREIYKRAEQDVLRWITIVDPASLSLLRNGFPLAEQYRAVEPETLATVSVRAISR